ncbi:MAG: sulfoxide reductase heme-binding subunit YedZ [Anaerolineae bacterium]|nr:sulfoxide reductase heme-binding subunit YedZ [Anaerolineae bacterium]
MDITRLQFFAHLTAWVPAILLVWDYLTGGLTADPVQTVTQRTGRAAIFFLVLSLSCTPLNILTGYKGTIRIRRALGLYSFMYAALHMIVFFVLDYRLDFSLIFLENFNKLYLWLGFCSFLLLSALAITSYPWWMRLLGKAWKILHRSVYIVGLLTVLHHLFARKGNLISLQGDIGAPLVYGVIVVILLVLRTPIIKRWWIQKRLKLKLPREFPGLILRYLDKPLF